MRPPTTHRAIRIDRTYTTGYTWFDNTPAGSATTSNPVLHQTAGGTGTYADPITVAVGHRIVAGHDLLDIPAGTRFYVPHLRRYFIVEDTCGDGPKPQTEACHSLATAPRGAALWLDLYVGGHPGDSPAAVEACASTITDEDGHELHAVIQNPPRNLPVVAGPLYWHGRCTHLYG